MKRKIFIAGMAVMLGVVTVLGCGKFAKMDIKAENSDETETILENSDETCELSLESMKNDGLLEYLNGGDVGSNEWYQDNFGKTETEQLTEEELYKIDGGDAEYWKHYDIEGNPNNQIGRNHHMIFGKFESGIRFAFKSPRKRKI